jgi:hypothetical protein
VTLDELILELQTLQSAGHGKVPVLVNDGLWDSNFDNAETVSLTTEYFYYAGVGSTKPCIKIET